MSKRRKILLSVGVVVVALSIFVQRDTFLRRWLLPSPPPQASTALLDTVVPEINFVHSTLGESIARLRRVSKLEIDLVNLPLPGSAPPGARMPQSFADQAGWRPGRGPPGTLHGLTVRQLLRRLLDNCDLVQDVAVSDDGGQVTLLPLAKRPADHARTYDIGDLLARPPDGKSMRTAKIAAQLFFQPPPTATAAGSANAPSGTPAAPPSPQVVRAAEAMSLAKDGVSGRIFRFGNRLICVGNSESQRNAQDLLAEERAKPPTPAAGR